MSFDALKTLNASGNETGRIALMITSDSYSDPICLVQGYTEQSLKDTNGVTHTFLPCSMSFSLPERNTSGFSDLTFAIGDTKGVVMSYVAQIMSDYNTADLVLLEYLPEETEPCYHLKLLVSHAEVTPKQATISAGWHDCLNLKFPFRRYTAKHFKGLRYVA